uniref:peptidyl-tRNA hydrolase n=2 Tax=Kalmanozyma brasiliensis (strain GHG001) TaxID=1365824 RepID=V5E738_KALBG
MQIIVDGSSSDLQSWPKGPWMAQAAHAAIAAIQISSSSPASQEYVSESNLASMHKVVLQTPKEGKAKMSLQDLSEKLSEARKVYEEGGEQGEEFPKHHLWVEQPEGLATCLALAPNRKPAALKKILRPCTLLKD